MKRSLIVFAALVILIVPTICPATPPRPGPYVSGFAGVSVPRDTDATTNDLFSNETFNERVEFDPGVYAGGTAGFDLGFLRLEGELSYRYSEIKAVTDNFSGFQFGNVDGNIGALAVMANAFIDLHNASPITPYFGGGVGFAVLHLDDTFGINSMGETEHLYPKDDRTVFAYQAGAGLEIALNPMLSLDVGYRYFGTDRARFESGDLKTSLKFESHNAVVGVRVKF
jgi:opacity protein-like surface antigen